MRPGLVRSVDLVAIAAALIAAAMAAVYVSVMHAQDDQPLAWVRIVLVGGAVASAVAAPTATPYRRALLWTAGGALLVLGLLAILTIGLPILVAGALAFLAGSRSEPARQRPSAVG